MSGLICPAFFGFHGISDSPDLRIFFVLILLPVIVSIPLLKRIMCYIALHRKASRDYQHARGTEHKWILRMWSMELEKEISSLENENSNLQHETRNAPDALALRRDQELYRHLIETRLPEAEGVGVKLTEKILDECFDGSMVSLRRAYIINGVGDSKQEAINRWVKGIMEHIQDHKKKGFPGEDRILMEFRKQEQERVNRMRVLDEELEELRGLEVVVRNELTILEEIDIIVFREAFFKIESEQMQPVMDTTSDNTMKHTTSDNTMKHTRPFNHYLQGVFPVWERAPGWFRKLKDRYGTEVDQNDPWNDQEDRGDDLKSRWNDQEGPGGANVQ